jgi:hypothetical protein
VRVSSIRWGIIWLGTGLLFLAINLELLDTLVFPRLFSLWPILLVAVGVEMMFRRTRHYFLALLSPILIAGAFIFAAYAKGDWGWNTDEFWRRWVWQAETKKNDIVEIPADSDVTAMELNLQCGSSEVRLRPTADRLFRASTEFYRRSPWVKHSNTDGVERVEFINREKTRLAIFGIKIAASKNELEIADFIPVRAAISAVDEEFNFDFSRMILRSLALDIHSNQSQVRIGDRADTVDIEIWGKAAILSLGLPTDFGIAIRGDSLTLAGLLDNSGLIPSSDGFRSVDYEINPRRINLQLEAEIDSVSFGDSSEAHAEQ